MKTRISLEVPFQQQAALIINIFIMVLFLLPLLIPLRVCLSILMRGGRIVEHVVFEHDANMDQARIQFQCCVKMASDLQIPWFQLEHDLQQI